MIFFRGIIVSLMLMSAAQAQNSQPSSPVLRTLDAQGIQSLRAKYKGKVLVLNFWATWCKPCVEEFPDFVRFHKSFSAKDAAVAFVSIDENDDKTKRKVISFLRKQNAPLPSYIKQSGDDEQFINAVHHDWSGAVPATFIYDKKGNLIVMKIEETTFSELDKAVQPLLR